MDTQERKYLIYAGVGLLVLVVAMMMLRGNQQPASGTVAPPSNALLNFWQKTAEDSNANALAHSQLAAQSLLSYVNARDNLSLGLANVNSQVEINRQNATSAEDIARINSDAQVQVSTLGANAAMQIAQYQRDAAANVAQWSYAATAAQANAASAASQAQSHAQQQVGLWNSIASIFSTVGSFFSKPSQNAPLNMNGVASTADLVQMSYP